MLALEKNRPRLVRKKLRKFYLDNYNRRIMIILIG